MSIINSNEMGPAKDFRIGDIVQNAHGPQSTRGCPLVCGCGWYMDAVVVSIEPFVLVSREGDMRWDLISAEERKQLRVISPGTADETREAFARISRDAAFQSSRKERGDV